MRVSRKLRNALRRERRENPTVETLLARDKAETAEKRASRQAAQALHAQLRHKGVTWAQAVQAIKTDWVAELRNKFR